MTCPVEATARSTTSAGTDHALPRARNSRSRSAIGVSEFSNSNVALRVAPMRKIRLSKKADMTPIDIMLPVNWCTSGTARSKYAGNISRESPSNSETPTT